MKVMYKKIIVAGFGGQGVMMIGQIIAQLANYRGYETLYFPSYGPETRGGTANCTVIISDKYINSPIFDKADILIILNKPSLDKFINKLENDGIILYNSSLIGENNKGFGVPINEISTTLNNPKVSNMVMLGAFLELVKIFELEDVFYILNEYLGESKRHLLDINKQAINLGIKYIIGEKNA